MHGGSDDARSTADMVSEAKAGSREAFDRLTLRYWNRLEAMIHLRLGDGLRATVDEDDVLQEVAMRGWQSLGQFEWRGKASFYHWLRGIAENVIRNLHRSGRTLKRNAGLLLSLSESRPGADRTGARLDELLAAEGPSPSTMLRRKERLERLENALNSLTPDHREVIILARVERLPMKEIAERMHRSVDASSMLLLRALRKLRAHFGEPSGSWSTPRPARAARGDAHDHPPEAAGERPSVK